MKPLKMCHDCTRHLFEKERIKLDFNPLMSVKEQILNSQKCHYCKIYDPKLKSNDEAKDKNAL